MADLDLKW